MRNGLLVFTLERDIIFKIIIQRIIFHLLESSIIRILLPASSAIYPFQFRSILSQQFSAQLRVSSEYTYYAIDRLSAVSYVRLFSFLAFMLFSWFFRSLRKQLTCRVNGVNYYLRPVFEPTGIGLLRYFGTRWYCPLIEDFLSNKTVAHDGIRARFFTRRLLFFDSQKRPIIKTSFYLWRGESFTGRYLCGFVHAARRSREVRIRHARESRSYQKLAFVKSRSRTKFKTTFRLSHRGSYFTAMISVGRGKRTAKRKDMCAPLRLSKAGWTRT